VFGAKPRKVSLPVRKDHCAASFFASYVCKIHVVDRIAKGGCALPSR
jgi:hypothetical protein